VLVRLAMLFGLTKRMPYLIAILSQVAFCGAVNTDLGLGDPKLFREFERLADFGGDGGNGTIDAGEEEWSPPPGSGGDDGGHRADFVQEGAGKTPPAVALFSSQQDDRGSSNAERNSFAQERKAAESKMLEALRSAKVESPGRSSSRSEQNDEADDKLEAARLQYQQEQQQQEHSHRLMREEAKVGTRFAAGSREDRGFGGPVASPWHAPPASRPPRANLTAGSLLASMVYGGRLGAGKRCAKYTGGECAWTSCSSSRGPTVCTNSKCMCKAGYCAKNGRCQDPNKCYTDTGGSCSWTSCASSRGPTTCNKDSKCICKAGYCAEGGKCMNTLASYFTGARGKPGHRGHPGRMGPRGKRGTRGKKGKAGAKGPPGDHGDPGPPGDVGQKGGVGPPQTLAESSKGLVKSNVVFALIGFNMLTLAIIFLILRGAIIRAVQQKAQAEAAVAAEDAYEEDYAQYQRSNSAPRR